MELFDKKIDYFKSHTLSVFALFQTNKQDAALFMSFIERADKQKTQFVSIEQFIHVYCGEYGDTFALVWSQYFRLLLSRHGKHGAQSKFDEMLSKSKYEDQVQRKKENEGIELMFPPYIDFMCFIMFFMTVDEKELIFFVYWLIFHWAEIRPDHQQLTSIIDVIWGKKPEVKYKKRKAFAKAQKIIAKTDSSEFCPKKLRMFDLRSGGAWSKPVKALKRRIQSWLGGRFWNRQSLLMESVRQDINGAYDRVRDRDHIHVTQWAKHDYFVFGERKDSRRSIRQFLRIYRSYVSMPLENENDALDDGFLTSRTSNLSIWNSQWFTNPSAVVARIVRKLYQRSMKVVPVTAFNVERKRNPVLQYLFPRWKARAIQYTPAELAAIQNQQQQANSKPLESLDVVYKEALTLPMDRIYRNIRHAQQETAKVLEECKKELGVDAHYKLHKQEIIDALLEERSGGLRGMFGGRPRRVIEVSSSESEGSVGSEDEGDGEEGDFGGDGDSVSESGTPVKKTGGKQDLASIRAGAERDMRYEAEQSAGDESEPSGNVRAVDDDSN